MYEPLSLPLQAVASRVILIRDIGGVDMADIPPVCDAFSKFGPSNSIRIYLQISQMIRK